MTTGTEFTTSSQSLRVIHLHNSQSFLTNTRAKSVNICSEFATPSYHTFCKRVYTSFGGFTKKGSRNEGTLYGYYLIFLSTFLATIVIWNIPDVNAENKQQNAKLHEHVYSVVREQNSFSTFSFRYKIIGLPFFSSFHPVVRDFYLFFFFYPK